MKKSRLFIFSALAAALLIPTARAQFVMGTLDPDPELTANSDSHHATQVVVLPRNITRSR